MTSATTQTGLSIRTFLLGSGPEDDTTRIQHVLSETTSWADAAGI